jgi:hypothetical protein
MDRSHKLIMDLEKEIRSLQRERDDRRSTLLRTVDFGTTPAIFGFDLFAETTVCLLVLSHVDESHTCEKIETKYRRRSAEVDRLDRWKREGATLVASMDRSTTVCLLVLSHVDESHTACLAGAIFIIASMSEAGPNIAGVVPKSTVWTGGSERVPHLWPRWIGLTNSLWEHRFYKSKPILS